MKTAIIKFDNVGKKYFLGRKKKRSIYQSLSNVHQEIKKSFSKEDSSIWALRNIDLTVDQGEVVGLIGRNGAGKTTLLKLLSRITEPSEGEITFQGRVSSILEIGAGFHLELSGHDNIFLNGSILGMTQNEIKDNYHDIVDFSGVGKFIHQPIKHYSSGMYVRLAFAVAAHLKSEILLVDEILAVGDEEFQQKCLGKMDSAAKSGRTLVLVSHNMALIRQLCTRVVIIEKGEIYYNGDVETGIEKYISLNRRLPTNYIVSPQFVFDDLIINKVQLRLQEQINQFFFHCGSSITINIHYLAKKTFRDIAIDIQICDSMNQLVISCNNFYSSDYLVLKNKGIVQCTIPKLPMTQGKYFIHIRINQLEKQIMKADFVAEFEVVEGDYYKTGRIVPFKNKILCENHWKNIEL
jgi:lipopolysaccharide transport system ATP-binding protein